MWGHGQREGGEKAYHASYQKVVVGGECFYFKKTLKHLYIVCFEVGCSEYVCQCVEDHHCTVNGNEHHK